MVERRVGVKRRGVWRRLRKLERRERWALILFKREVETYRYLQRMVNLHKLLVSPDSVAIPATVVYSLRSVSVFVCMHSKPGHARVTGCFIERGIIF